MWFRNKKSDLQARRIAILEQELAERQIELALQRQILAATQKELVLLRQSICDSDTQCANMPEICE